MLHIDIVCIGKLKELYFREAAQEYIKRLSKYCALKIIELPDEKIPDKLNPSLSSIIKEKESNAIVSSLKKDTYLIALDLNGKEFSSEDFSKKLDTLSFHTNHITFLIGGTLGMSDTLLSSTNENICFSKMTFPHPLIRIFLLEQLFRAFKISSHETYHR